MRNSSAQKILRDALSAPNSFGHPLTIILSEHDTIATISNTATTTIDDVSTHATRWEKAHTTFFTDKGVSKALTKHVQKLSKEKNFYTLYFLAKKVQIITWIKELSGFKGAIFFNSPIHIDIISTILENRENYFAFFVGNYSETHSVVFLPARQIQKKDIDQLTLGKHPISEVHFSEEPTEEAIAGLPNSVNTVLFHCGVSRKTLQALPSHIRNVGLHSQQILPDAIAALPDTVIKVSFGKGVSEEKVRALANKKVVSVAFTPMVRVEVVKALPNQVKNVSFSNYFDNYIMVDDVLPEKVKALPSTVSCVTFAPSVSETAIEALPPGVTIVIFARDIIAEKKMELSFNWRERYNNMADFSKKISALPKTVQKVIFPPTVRRENIFALPKTVSAIYLYPGTADNVIQEVKDSVDGLNRRDKRSLTLLQINSDQSSKEGPTSSTRPCSSGISASSEYMGTTTEEDEEETPISRKRKRRQKKTPTAKRTKRKDLDQEFVQVARASDTRKVAEMDVSSPRKVAEMDVSGPCKVAEMDVSGPRPRTRRQLEYMDLNFIYEESNAPKVQRLATEKSKSKGLEEEGQAEGGASTREIGETGASGSRRQTRQSKPMGFNLSSEESKAQEQQRLAAEKNKCKDLDQDCVLIEGAPLSTREIGETGVSGSRRQMRQSKSIDFNLRSEESKAQEQQRLAAEKPTAEILGQALEQIAEMAREQRETQQRIKQLEAELKRLESLKKTAPSSLGKASEGRRLAKEVVQEIETSPMDDYRIIPPACRPSSSSHNSYRIVGASSGISFSGYTSLGHQPVSTCSGSAAPARQRPLRVEKAPLQGEPLSKEDLLPEEPDKLYSAKAKYDYQAQKHTMLSFKQGDVLRVLDDKGLWWFCELGNTFGRVPSNYLQRLPTPGSSASPSCSSIPSPNICKSAGPSRGTFTLLGHQPVSTNASFWTAAGQKRPWVEEDILLEEPDESFTAKAKYDYQAKEPGKLSFNKGDELKVLDDKNNWWYCELRGKRGVVPSNYLQRLSTPGSFASPIPISGPSPK